ncbi:MAG: hypothetical protein A3G76_01015 [Acidobacteria bacterium RIFCSPLOWO2_12_FULL_65_11]|nr:MAG: hypothetical protein A3H95_16275 [Acidobacteria bacterium RIFCSPLOWO2_02_FULL_64_15]OFW33390.1 MAG: hypothetical protein A3G76_01015 [Acidobacteria bacterium RIFCSPLOWO2_12_FULL_65_11]
MSLLHLCDSLFPLGGFAHSDGLESATSSGAVSSASDLGHWLDVCLDEAIGRLDGPAVLHAWTAFHDRDWEALARLDQEVVALRPSSSARRASRAMGSRLLVTWQALYPDPRLAHALRLTHEGRLGPALPVAFAGACVAAGIDRRDAVDAFAYTRLAATISSAMRLMPIGQSEAHRLLTETLARVPATVDAMIEKGWAPESFAPAMDIATMTQQYLHSRLFRS